MKFWIILCMALLTVVCWFSKMVIAALDKQNRKLPLASNLLAKEI